MKRNGYTIAEILITLTIIGVVAMLTIPTLVSNYRKRVYTTTLSTAIANFENALTTTIMKNNVDNLFLVRAWQNGGNELLSNLNIAYSKASFDEEENSYNIVMKNGTVYNFTIQTSDPNSLPEERIMELGTNLRENAGDLTIDINGKSKPNSLGRDTFNFIIGSDGRLYPIGGKDWSIYNDKPIATLKTECIYNNNMDFCGAYLIENGYRMNY